MTRFLRPQLSQSWMRVKLLGLSQPAKSKLAVWSESRKRLVFVNPQSQSWLSEGRVENVWSLSTRKVKVGCLEGESKTFGLCQPAKSKLAVWRESRKRLVFVNPQSQSWLSGGRVENVWSLLTREVCLEQSPL